MIDTSDVSNTSEPLGSFSSSEPITLVLPPKPELSKIARLTGSALAAISGYTLEEIEDIKIAISEILIALIEHGSGSYITLEFLANKETAGSKSFAVYGQTVTKSFNLDDPDLRLCHTVLEGVGATPKITFKDQSAGIAAIITKTITN
ncbi:MAG: hypothetical protein ACSLFB_11615 [Acidimicrobiales bacterium]